MPLTDAQWEPIDRIQGWLTRQEADLLHNLGGTPWLEIGAWRGRSTRVLMLNGPGYTIDHFQGSPYHTLEQDPSGVRYDWIRNTDGLVSVYIGDFKWFPDRVPDGLALLFIDHDHSYRPTMDAWELYSPKVAPGGHVVFHDAVWDPTDAPQGNPWTDVTQAVAEIAELGPPWERLDDVGRCAIFRRLP